MTRQRRSAAEISAILQRYDESGQSQKSFCDDEGLALSTLTYWLGKRRERPSTALVAVTSAPSSIPFVLEFGDFRLEIPRDATIDEWRRVREAWSE